MGIQAKTLALTGGLLLLSLGIGHRAQATDFAFSYTGIGINASGTLTATPFDPVSNTYQITSLTGQRNGEAITRLLNLREFADNDNLFYQAGNYFDLQGISFAVNNQFFNLFYGTQNALGGNRPYFTGYGETSNPDIACTALPTCSPVTITIQSSQAVPEPLTVGGALVAGAAAWGTRKRRTGTGDTSVR